MEVKGSFWESVLSFVPCGSQGLNSTSDLAAGVFIYPLSNLSSHGTLFLQLFIYINSLPPLHTPIIQTYTLRHTYTYTNTYTHKHTYSHIHTYRHRHTYTYTHTHEHTLRHTYTHTHTHTYTDAFINTYRVSRHITNGARI